MESFSGRLRELQGKRVCLERGGPHMLQGSVVGVKADYLVMADDYGGLIHIPTRHLKSVSWDISSDQEMTVCSYPNAMATVSSLPDTFAGLVASLRGSPVQVNEDGPEKVQGILLEAGTDHLRLVTNQGNNKKNQKKNNQQNQSQGQSQNQNQQNNQLSQLEMVTCPFTHIRSIRRLNEAYLQSSQQSDQSSQQSQSSDSGGGSRVRVVTGRGR